jgi:hypothetical protein
MSSLIDAWVAGTRSIICPHPKDTHMRVSDDILKCVGFISHPHPTELNYLGTVSIVMTRDGMWHLVTAKHVAEMFDPGTFVVAVNAKDGAPRFLKSGDDIEWFYHPTEKESVDVAVCPLASPNLDLLDSRSISEMSFVSEAKIAEYGIGLGDEILAVGLFTRFFGTSKIIPIVRTGNIAMMPTDKIPVKDFGEIEAYLAESRSIGGLSGSPVFVRSTMNLPTKTTKGEPAVISGLGPLHFLGLMHGHWELPLDFSTIEQAEAVNMGVSIIIPAKKVLEVLYHPELVKMRLKAKETKNDKHFPVADSSIKPAPFTRVDFEAALKKASRKKYHTEKMDAPKG